MEGTSKWMSKWSKWNWELLPHWAGRDRAPPGTGSEDAHQQPWQELGARAEAGDAGLNPHSTPSCRRHWSKEISPSWQCQPPTASAEQQEPLSESPWAA